MLLRRTLAGYLSNGQLQDRDFHPIRSVRLSPAHQRRSTWAEGSCEPERFIVAGDKIVVFIHVRVRLKHETEWREGRIVDVYTFRNGKAIQFRTFADRQQALEWAGVEDSDAN